MKITLLPKEYVGDPESTAMLQAFFSRSTMSITDRLELLGGDMTSVKASLKKVYLGFGHASVSDCGYTSIFIEDVSMLAAKAIQDNPLYNGQESSSRYIDWSEQRFHNPFVGFSLEAEAEELLTQFRNFYVTQKPIVIQHLKQTYPIKEGENEKLYEKAITAKAFDILRGYLPCGATTNVAWTTSLRKANEHVSYLARHPLEEVRKIAKELHSILIEAYPNSIAAWEEPEEGSWESYGPHYYSNVPNLTDSSYKVSDYGHLQMHYEKVGSFDLKEDCEFYNERPRRGLLPKHDIYLQEELAFSFKLDFGSYRDLQRHRAGYCSVPIIDNTDGFHPWYYQQLPLESKLEANKLFGNLCVFLEKSMNIPTGIENRETDNAIFKKLLNQYILPMGTLVPVYLRYNLHQVLYVSQLRSGQTVHATLRPVAQSMARFMEDAVGIRTDADFSADEWTLRRGSQDIVSKLV